MEVPPGHMFQQYINVLEKTFLKDASAIHIFVNNPPNISNPLFNDDIYAMIAAFEAYPQSLGKKSTIYYLDDWFHYMSSRRNRNPE
jgi:hypothetical protein